MDPNKPKNIETLWLREYRNAWLAELARQKEAAGNVAPVAVQDDKNGQSA